ncbi:MAG: M23 family metallopeptidase [Chloroflexi bacterium]|nr:M23 family metallopeptidase [Chloroflexota bacterium]
MQNNTTRLQLIGKIVIWLIVFGFLIVGWRAGVRGESEMADVGGETAVSLTTSTTATTTPNGLPDTDLPIISDSSLVPAPNPYTLDVKLPQHTFQTYIVQRGDTPNGIAEQFGINAETLLGGNPQLSQESSLLQTDVELIILPINGVLHDVQPGDTLEGLSLLYGVLSEDIIAYPSNNLEFPYRLEPETQIMIPGAVPPRGFQWTPPDLSSVSSSSPGLGNGVTPIIQGTGTFIYPVGSSNFSQYYWYGHPAVDIALSVGSAVYASDTGTVTYAGWNTWGYGNLIVVNHGNGFETLYGHLSSINVVPGQIVYQGNVIGGSGNTGNSSGPHIHFEIRVNGNQDNPCWYLGCG